eukprot:g48458.t1
MDAGGELVSRDGDGEVQEGDGGVRNCLDEFEDGVEGVGKVDELLKLVAGARGSNDAVINIVEKEARDCAGVFVGLFHKSYKEAGIAQAHAGGHGHPFGLYEVGGIKGKTVECVNQFCQTNESVSGGGLVGPTGEAEMEDTGIKGLYVYSEDEVLGAGKLKVLEMTEGMGYVANVGREYLDQRGKNRVEIGGEELSEAGAGRDNGSTWAVGFMDFGK